MKQYIISIGDDKKANQLLALLSDLSYVKILGSPETRANFPSKCLPLMDNPFPVENFRKYSREELYER